MKNFIKTGTAILGAVLIMSSCEKDDSTGSGKLSYQVKPANFTATIGTTISGSGLPTGSNTNSSITWTSGSLYISEIDFEAESKDREIEYEFKQGVSVDLFNLSPILGSITIPDGTYDEVELGLELKKSSTNIPLTLKGTYTDGGGAKIPVEFYLNEDFEVEVEAEDLVVSGSNDYLGLINVQLNKFMTNVLSADLSNATKTSGVIVISSTSNMNLYAKLKANLNAFADCDFDD
ncbi:MAG: hypothetical protein WBJ10_15035 [Daejeonella sp.]|uniref:hypothetical protein n=1 Tax=Daejeonella sp. TaxID=2805397 RepID=UPI003C77F5A4